MGSGNELENTSPDYIMGRIDALDEVHIEAEELKQKIAELEAELERRPVVYCYRNKHGELARHFGSGSLALWAKPEEHEATNPELEWKIEVYTGEES